MARTPTAPLALTQLETREVPAAALFADVRAGVWGSYPLNLTPSGNALYFTADNGYGYELYRTDGTPGSAKMVKDLRPGPGASNPRTVLAADNGVVYFTADDGTGRALWRSDGTAAGTTKVPGVPPGAFLDRGTHEGASAQIGLNGKLYFAARASWSGAHQELWVTDGTATTRLATLGLSYSVRNVLAAAGDKVTVTRFDMSVVESVWVTDGTPGGTKKQQGRMIGRDPSLPIGVSLSAGTEVRPGVFVHTTRATYDQKSTLWVSDGLNQSSVRMLAAIPNQGTTETSAQTLVRVGDKLFFSVQSTDPRYGGVWETDGTAAGTKRVDVTPGTELQVTELRAFDGGLLFKSYDAAAGRYRFYLSNGTAAGTSEVALPEAPTSAALVGQFPADAAHPRGALVFKLGAAGRLYVTDGTTGGWADTAGLPTGFNPRAATYPTDSAGRAVSATAQAGVFFNGSVYFQAGNGDQRPELWKWDPAPAPTQGVPPAVLSVAVNDGSPDRQRSAVTSLIVSFDRAVNIEDGALQLTDAKGNTHPLYVESPVQGQATLNINFGGKSLPDGRYTLAVKAGKVTAAATGAGLAADYTFTFTRLFGDLNGDGVYDRDARTKVRNALGARVGNDDRYLAALDWNMDGVIDGVDELAAVRNWGKTV
jgi:ELWxxDGT repeat protein